PASTSLTEPPEPAGATPPPAASEATKAAPPKQAAPVAPKRRAMQATPPGQGGFFSREEQPRPPGSGPRPNKCGGGRRLVERLGALEHDPEKWVPVFGKDHAPAITATSAGWSIPSGTHRPPRPPGGPRGLPRR